ncbi:DoxX-like family protein [Bacterioplanes sanyensis]|uniref:DoxX-like family protein n=1 Tax=Bacterioplanes sanyensis TaxID=1249553 RepID=UPI001E34F72F|nr:DoxX-like family protein [Bacterioplanes sanyensis]
MNSTRSSYAICRVTLAFIWFYHGLVPKLLSQHKDELAMNMALGMSHAEAVNAAQLAGIAEIVMALCMLVFWRQRWPLWLTLAAMPVLLTFVLLVQPQLALGAFNPVTTNIAVMALAWLTLQLQHEQST